MTAILRSWSASGRKQFYASSSAGAIGIGGTKNVPVVFKVTDPDGNNWLPTGATPAGFTLQAVETNRLSWYLKTTAASAGSRIEGVGAYDPTFATPYLWAICPDVVAIGEYTSNQTRTLVPAVGGTATAALEWRSPFPFFFLRFINGATAQGAACELVAYVGE